MSTSGDIAVLQFGSDNKWHWQLFTPAALSTFSFNTGGSISLGPLSMSAMSNPIKATIDAITAVASGDPGALFTAMSGEPAARIAGDAAGAAYTDTRMAALGSAASHSATDFDAAGAATAAQAAAVQRANHTGTQSADTITDGSTNKAYSAADKTKLAALLSITVDTGWTANGTAGDKTVAVQAYTNGITGTMVTALNVTSGGLGTALSALADQVAALTKKLAAHETALAANKLPNA